MAEALAHDENKTLRILLVGHTGHGKSSTGNSLLGYKKKDKRGFVSKRSAISVTTTAETRVETRFGHRLEVADCPGFADTSGSDDFIKREIGKALFWTLPGFHCIAFVLRPDRITESITQTIESFFDFFGKDVGAYACLILTNIQDEEEMTDYIKSMEPNNQKQSKNENFNKLFDLCQGKVLPIENTNEMKEREQQVENILNRIDRMKTENRNPYFTNDMFAAAMEAIDEREKKRIQMLEDKKREQEREEQRREEELRRLQEEKEQIKKEAESKIVREREIHESWKKLQLELEKEKEKHNFELQKLNREMDREREQRMQEMRSDFQRHEKLYDRLFQNQNRSPSSGCILS